jgi:hypothetical protein
LNDYLGNPFLNRHPSVWFLIVTLAWSIREITRGIYVAGAAEATMGAGAGATVMKNDKGVVIHIFSPISVPRR